MLSQSWPKTQGHTYTNITTDSTAHMCDSSHIQQHCSPFWFSDFPLHVSLYVLLRTQYFVFGPAVTLLHTNSINSWNTFALENNVLTTATLCTAWCCEKWSRYWSVGVCWDCSIILSLISTLQEKDLTIWRPLHCEVHAWLEGIQEIINVLYSNILMIQKVSYTCLLQSLEGWANIRHSESLLNILHE